MTEKALKGFKSMSLKYTLSNSCTHTMYMKEHVVREYSADKPPGRTLFILNVPPFINVNHLRNMFSQVGKIQSVSLQNKPSSSDKQESSDDISDCSTGYKVSYVVFVKNSDLKRALDMNELQPACEESDHSQNGAQRWIREYNSSIPNVQKMKQEIEEFMKKYDKGNAKKVSQDKALGEADEDGWITVTKHGKKTGFERKESIGNKITSKEKTRREKLELKNFYTFQIRESKMKHIISLRQKFEEDKKKIAKLKESRRFKPF